MRKAVVTADEGAIALPLLCLPAAGMHPLLSLASPIK
jgi:hypothetical protein